MLQEEISEAVNVLIQEGGELEQESPIGVDVEDPWVFLGFLLKETK